MAMYYYASKISAIACGTRCKQTVLQKSRGQRDRDKFHEQSYDFNNATDDDANGDGCHVGVHSELGIGNANAAAVGNIYVTDAHKRNADSGAATSSVATISGTDGVRFRRRFSEQLDTYDMDADGFEHLNGNAAYSGYSNVEDDIVQYDVPRNTHKRSQNDINFESCVLGSGGIMYINGRIISGPLDSLIEVLIPKNIMDFDEEFIFSFLLSSRLFLRPHELLGKLLSLVPDSECLESLVALLAEWTQKFPYDYRDERMMNHVKHIVARCSNSHLEAAVSDVLSALLKRLTDLELHEEQLRACQVNTEKSLDNSLDCRTATQYAQILCRLEKKLAKHIGPEEFLQCSSNILLDKQKKWDQPSTSGGPPGAQDPKKTCNLETYLDWSARLRLFVCNEILQCTGIRDRSKIVELWSGVAQYCLLVGNYNSATAILESLESPPIARLKITWSNLQVTCQQLDCMQRHAEGHGNLWQKQAIVLNETTQQQQQQKLHRHHRQQQQQQQQKKQQTIDEISSDEHIRQHQEQQQLQKTDPMMTTTTAVAMLSASSSTLTTATDTTALTTASSVALSETMDVVGNAQPTINTAAAAVATTKMPLSITTSDFNGKLFEEQHQQQQVNGGPATITNIIEQPPHMSASLSSTSTAEAAGVSSSYGNYCSSSGSKNKSTTTKSTAGIVNSGNSKLSASGAAATAAASSSSISASTTKPNDWVVIPVFADIVKLALAGREECLQSLPNGHINITAFDRMAAMVGAFTKHMHTVKAATESPTDEYEMFCRHMQKSTKLYDSELMMASFDCEEPNNAEKNMYDLN